MGIDEFNNLRSANETSFRDMTRKICSIYNTSGPDLFLMVMLSGTQESAIKNAISESQNPSLSLPVPLLKLKQIEEIMNELVEEGKNVK